MPSGGIPILVVAGLADDSTVNLLDLFTIYLNKKVDERCQVCETPVRQCPIVEKRGRVRFIQIYQSKGNGFKSNVNVTISLNTVACLLHIRKYSTSV